VKILLLGHDGQVGWELVRELSALGQVKGYSYPDIDYSRPADIRRLVREEQPGLIVNAAAYTAVDKAEEELDLAMAVNGTAPGVLAEEARKLGAVFVHYSTDFVFGGDKRVPYVEDDTPAPLGAYGMTKLAGERAVQSVGGCFFIFRLSWVYGLRGENFLLKLRKLAEEKPELRVVDDQVGSPTWCRAVARATASVLKGGDAGTVPEETCGLYHMTCAGQTSWYAFAKAFLPDGTNLVPVSTDEYPTPACRPAYSVLDCGRLRETFGVSMPAWQEALKECLA